MKKIFLLMFAAAAALGSWAQTNALSATVSGDKLTVSLDNETSYVAFQMDIALPEGVTVDATGAIQLNEARLDKKATVSVAGADNSDFTVAYNVITGNVLRVVAYNLENRQIVGQTGDLFTVTLQGYTEGDIDIDNVKFVTKELLAEEALNAVKAEEGSAFDPYDVNKDTSVDTVDAMLVLNCYLNNDPYNKLYDINNDDTVDTVDAMLILNKYLGI